MELSIAQTYVLLSSKKGKFRRFKKNKLAVAILFDLMLNGFITIQNRNVFKQNEITEEFIYYKPLLDYVGSKEGIPVIKFKNEASDINEGGFLKGILTYFKKDFIKERLMREEDNLVYTNENVYESLIQDLDRILCSEAPTNQEVLKLAINQVILKKELGIQKMDVIDRKLRHINLEYSYLLRSNISYFIMAIPLITFLPSIMSFLSGGVSTYTILFSFVGLSMILSFVVLAIFEFNNLWKKIQ